MFSFSLPPLVLAVALTFLPNTSLTARDAPERFAQWESAIAAFEAKDQHSPQPANAILFVGSSSIRMWDLPKSFPGEKTINRGFGGSEIADSTHFASRLVFPLKPRQIVLYAGDNDIANGKTAKEVTNDFEAFVATVRGAMPDVPVAYIAIKPSIARWKLWPTIQAANSAIQTLCGKDPSLTFIDIAPAMIGEDGKPRPELFLEDGLHLSLRGYALWNDAVRKAFVPAAN